MGYFDNPNRSGDNYNNTPRSQNDSVEDEVFSVPVKAGKRIYYFDVKATRGDDYYVTITESRKRPTRDGGFTIDKHKIHLYKEDFMKFAAGLEEVLAYVRREKPEFAEAEARGDFNKPYEPYNAESASTELTAQDVEPLEKELFGDL